MSPLAPAPDYVVAEILTRTAPFGLGLWDTVAHRLVSDDIDVRVFTRAADRLVRPMPAVPSRHGIFTPHDLLGAAAFDESLRGATTSPPHAFVVEVRDTRNRYTSFVMDAIRGRGGFATLPCMATVEQPSPHESSPPVTPAFVPLFPLASQPVPAGMAVVRASMVDVNGGPAAFAVLEVRESGRLLARSIADERGEVAAVFAYPEVTAQPPWSPPGTPPPTVTMSDQQWTIDIAVRYRRGVRLWTTGPQQSSLPDLCDLLRQPLAKIGVTPPPAADALALELCYGQDVVVGADPQADPDADHRAELLISPV